MDQPHFWLRFKGQKGNTVQAVRCKIKLITAKRRNALWTNASLCENDVTLECHRGSAEGVKVIECHNLEGKGRILRVGRVLSRSHSPNPLQWDIHS